MLLVLHVAAVVLTALTLSPALAHALELPGKLRLTREAYLTVQPIYFPGFTIIGFSEFLAILATFALLLILPAGSAPYWWTVVAIVSLLAMHGVYWIVTHPVNKFWLKDQNLTGASSGFFGFDPLGQGRGVPKGEGAWRSFRNRWELSHVLRAVLATIALIAITLALAL